MIQRVITGAGFAALVLACILIQGWAMLALLGVCMLISTHEIYAAFRAARMRPVRWAGCLFCILVIAAYCLNYALNTDANYVFIAFLISALAAMCHLVLRGKIAADRLIATLFPMLYPGIFYIALLQLLQMESRAAVCAALVLSFFAASVNDVFALFSGMLLGRHKLSPELSPKKTIEGSIGGLIASTLFSMATPALLRWVFAGDPAFIGELALLPPAWAFALLGLLAGGLSQIGDLTASMIKRFCGVKDFGRLLPGHGGIMDRLDGVLFCGAACYIFFTLCGLG